MPVTTTAGANDRSHERGHASFDAVRPSAVATTPKGARYSMKRCVRSVITRNATATSANARGCESRRRACQRAQPEGSRAIGKLGEHRHHLEGAPLDGERVARAVGALDLGPQRGPLAVPDRVRADSHARSVQQATRFALQRERGPIENPESRHFVRQLEWSHAVIGRRRDRDLEVRDVADLDARRLEADRAAQKRRRHRPDGRPAFARVLCAPAEDQGGDDRQAPGRSAGRAPRHVATRTRLARSRNRRASAPSGSRSLRRNSVSTPAARSSRSRSRRRAAQAAR